MKGFKKLFKQDKVSKKNVEKFYKLLSKQAIRVLQAFKEKRNKACKYKSKQASKEKFYKLLSKQAIRVLQAFKEKRNKASKYKSKQAKKSFRNF